MKPIAVSVALALVIIGVTVGVAFAHESRTVGKYQLVVGFATEPAYSNLPNSVDLRVTNTETKQPVEGLDKSLSAEVIFGAKSTPVKLRARFGQPGAYLGDFIPTRAGTYIFHFTGQIENIKIDERFESGPNTFSDVRDPGEMQFPESVPAPLDIARQAQSAQDTAGSAQTLAYVGIGVGALGLIAAALALVRK